MKQEKPIFKLKKFHKELLQLITDHLVGKDVFTDDINTFYDCEHDCQIANLFKDAKDVQEGLIDNV